MKLKVENTLCSYDMIKKNDKVLVALSGGADSVALLHVLNSIKEKYNLTLYACHVNHNLRGKESLRDENFVKALCDELNIELFVKSVDVLSLSKESKTSVELCGRNVRYAYFSDLSSKLGAKIATAHTASDNVETVLYNIARGTSITGLCGIKPVRGNIIRPLIFCTREEIESYCKENGLNYVTDSTNLTDDYTRNNIRHNAVPVFKSLNPDLCDSVSRMCGDLTEIKVFLDEISEKEIKNCETKFGYSCEKLLQLPQAVLKNSIYVIAKRRGCDISHRHIELICDALKDASSVDLPFGMRAVCKQGVLRIVSQGEKTEVFETEFKDCGLFEYISAEEIKNINKNFLNDCISYDIIDEKTVVRHKKEGDTFTFFERGVTKSLKKLLNELKIPAEKRSNLLVVANGSKVLWIEGVGTSKDGKTGMYKNGAYRYIGGKP